VITTKQIRKDLSDIRYYYANQKEFDQASKSIVQSAIADKIERYNQAIKNAPIRLYRLYVSLYVQNNTHSAVAYEWDCCDGYIKLLSTKLNKFLLENLSDDTK